MEKLNDEIEAVVSRNYATMKHWMRAWVHNSIINHGIFRNEEHSHSLFEMKDQGRLRPAIIVGGGASLDDILDDEVKCAKIRDMVNSEEAILLCPNSVVRPLPARGIKPWAYIAMHPTGDIVNGFRLGPNDWLDFENKRLITATAIHPNVVNRWLGIDSYGQHTSKSGEIYLTIHDHADPLRVVVGSKDGQLAVRDISSKHSPSDWYGAVQPLMWNKDGDTFDLFPWQKKGHAIPEMNNMGCVVNYGILVATILGCGPILTIGTDFSYVPDENDHPRERCDDWRFEEGAFVRQKLTPNEHMAKIGLRPIKEADGIKGNKLLCSNSMVSYRGSIQSIFKNLKHRSGEPVDLVNCSGDGIVVDLPRMDICEALDTIKGGKWCQREQ